jgi:nicotinate-nucleotide adenylyltransferase
MVQLTFGGDVRFEVSSMELERGGLSYTVDTLEALKAQYADADLTVLMGTDSYRTMDRWKRPERIRELAQVALLARAGNDDQVAPPGVTVVTTRRVDVSASEIRARVAAGKSIRGFVAESVERYISAAELYRATAAG